MGRYRTLSMSAPFGLGTLSMICFTSTAALMAAFQRFSGEHRFPGEHRSSQGKLCSPVWQPLTGKAAWAPDVHRCLLQTPHKSDKATRVQPQQACSASGPPSHKSLQPLPIMSGLGMARFRSGVNNVPQENILQAHRGTQPRPPWARGSTPDGGTMPCISKCYPCLCRR